MNAVVPGFRELPIVPPPLPFHAVEPAIGCMDFRLGTHVWNPAMNSNLAAAALVAGLTDERMSEVRQVLDGMIRELYWGGAATLHSEPNIWIGTRRTGP